MFMSAHHHNKLLAAPTRALAALALAAAVTLALLSSASAQTFTERDFFGTVVSVDETSLVVATDDGDVEVLVTDETEVKIPSQDDATISDLLPGDVVAISLEEEGGLLVADKIHLIPGKTRDRHVPGEVIGLTDAEITILTPGADETLTFRRTGDTELRFHRGTDDLAVGDFVVIVARRESGVDAPIALEINVTRRPADPGEKPVAAHAEVDDEVRIHGVLEAIDGHVWTVDGHDFSIDADTKIEDAVTIGQLVDVEALLLADGTVLATEIEVEEEDKIASTTRIRGIFEGTDDAGRWLISGTPVIVNDDTDTDGMPEIGQTVKVKAILIEDGSLVAREIENKHGSRGHDDADGEIKIEGIFEGFTDDGRWIVNGVKFAVSPLTKIEGKPAVGGSVEIKAIMSDDGKLVATKIESDGDSDKRKSETEIHGVITEVLTDAIVVNGFTIVLSDLTEIDVELVVGMNVEVEALLGEGGVLIAREIEREDDEDEDGERSKVEIEGVIDLINDDGSIVVNGITVNISALTKVKGSLSLGGKVKVKGVLSTDGTLTAREVKGEGRRGKVAKNEIDVRGTVDAFEVDADGNIVSLVVDGVEIIVDALTEFEGDISVGASVKAEGVLVDGVFILGEIESDERRGRGRHRGHGADDDKDEEDEKDEERERGGELNIEGTVDDVILGDDGRIAAIVVSGVEVRITRDTKIEGALEEGADVELKAFAEAGVITATKVEADEREIGRETTSASRERDEDRGRDAREIKLRGTIDDVGTDASGSVTVIAVDGTKIVITEDTRVEGTLVKGAEVKLVAELRDGALVAIEVESEIEDEDDEPREERFEGEIEKVATNDAGVVTRIVVEGHDLIVDRETESDVPLAVGVGVEVKAVLVDGQWFARRIEAVETETEPTPAVSTSAFIPEPTPEPTPAPSTSALTTEPTPEPTPEVIDETFEGEIEALEDGEGTVTHITVAGTVILITGETDVEVDLVVGANVKVKAVLEGGDWIATRVRPAG